jgi:hypothetical protein
LKKPIEPKTGSAAQEFNNSLGLNMHKVSPKAIYDYLIENNVTHVHALGMLANIKGESEFNPIAQEKGASHGRGGYGLFQHTGSRRRSLEQFCKSRGIYTGDWKAQIDYALTERDTVQYLEHVFPDAAAAATWWTVYWERPRNAQAQAAKRVRFLPEIEKEIGYV